VTWRGDLDPALTGRPDLEGAVESALAEIRSEVEGA
jgi:hypothetical protein